MSGRDDDVFDVEDLRAGLGRVRGVGGDSVFLGVALAVIAVALALALIPHVLGAVGADAIDTGDGPSPSADAGENQQLRYQNYLANLVFVFAPSLLPMVAVAIAFAGALRVTGSRLHRVGTVVAGGAVGVAIGYAVLVVVAHLAFAEGAEGYFVDEFPVTIRWVTLAVNALALATVAAVGSVVAGVAGTLVEREPGVERVAVVDDATAAGDEDADADDATADAGERTDANADASDRDAHGDRPTVERPARLDDASEDASASSGPASDYRETGPQRSSGSRTPTYDPNGRNWDGSGDESS